MEVAVTGAGGGGGEGGKCSTGTLAVNMPLSGLGGGGGSISSVVGAPTKKRKKRPLIAVKTPLCLKKTYW